MSKKEFQVRLNSAALSMLLAVMLIVAGTIMRAGIEFRILSQSQVETLHHEAFGWAMLIAGIGIFTLEVVGLVRAFYRMARQKRLQISSNQN